MITANAPFNELKGIGPATEAKLHTAGLRTWAALAETLDAIAGVRDIDAARMRSLRDEARKKIDEPQPALVSDGEQASRFILAVAVRSDGQVARTNIKDVRSALAKSFNGLAGADIVEFIEQRIGEPASGTEVVEELVGHHPSAPTESDEADRSKPIRFTASSTNNDVVTIDAGKVIGGGERHVELRWETAGVDTGAATDFRFRASLAGRRYGVGVTRWRSLGTLTGVAQPGEIVELSFDAAGLSRGINRLELTIEVRPIAQTGPRDGGRRFGVRRVSVG